MEGNNFARNLTIACIAIFAFCVLVIALNSCGSSANYPSTIDSSGDYYSGGNVVCCYFPSSHSYSSHTTIIRHTTTTTTSKTTTLPSTTTKQRINNPSPISKPVSTGGGYAPIKRTPIRVGRH